jgi:uncharacterized protein YndB with AHSA1/START domain
MTETTNVTTTRGTTDTREGTMTEATKQSSAGTRSFETAIDIPAAVEDVWRALTEADELVRWFPHQARVKPGPGGSMAWAWGESWGGDMRIEIWEPGRRLRLVQEDAHPFDAEGRPLAGDTAQPVRLALDIELESGRGQTRLRLVHSGFGHGAHWDEELDGISSGWQFELRSLRHYLTHHRGRDRQIGWAMITTDEPAAAAWERLFDAEGFPIEGQREVGSPYAVNLPTGDRLTGGVVLHLPEREFAGTVAELNQGLFRLCIHRAGGRTGVIVVLATYDGDRERVSRFQARAQDVLQDLFAMG